MPLGKIRFMSSRKHLAPNNTKDHCKHFWSVLIECRLQDCFARPHYPFKCFFSCCILLSNGNNLHLGALFVPGVLQGIHPAVTSPFTVLLFGLRVGLWFLGSCTATLMSCKGQARRTLGKPPSTGSIEGDVQSRC